MRKEDYDCVVDVFFSGLVFVFQRGWFVLFTSDLFSLHSAQFLVISLASADIHLLQTNAQYIMTATSNYCSANN